MARPNHYEDDQVVVRKLCVGPMENNAYLVVCRATSAAVGLNRERNCAGVRNLP